MKKSCWITQTHPRVGKWKEHTKQEHSKARTTDSTGKAQGRLQQKHLYDNENISCDDISVSSYC